MIKKIIFDLMKGRNFIVRKGEEEIQMEGKVNYILKFL
jgi:hypothetical protein